MRVAYLIAGLIVAAMVIANVPRLPWIDVAQSGNVPVFRGFAHGLIGLSYVAGWTLIVAGVYQIILGVVYWDMDTSESERWQFTLESGGTAKLLWGTGAFTLLAGAAWAFYAFHNDRFWWPAGIASSLVSLIACWLLWLAFPLLEQVGMDRDQIGV